MEYAPSQNKDFLKQLSSDAPMERPRNVYYPPVFQQLVEPIEEKHRSLTEDLLHRRIKDLSIEVNALRKTIAVQTEKYEVVLNKIYSLPSDEWMLIEPIDVILKISDNETIALIPDLELYSEGRNEMDAISELKFEILDLIDDLFELTDEDLGQAPKGWKKSLKQIVKKCQ
jgi:hypothetical protein